MDFGPALSHLRHCIMLMAHMKGRGQTVSLLADLARPRAPLYKEM